MTYETRGNMTYVSGWKCRQEVGSLVTGQSFSLTSAHIPLPSAPQRASIQGLCLAGMSGCCAKEEILTGSKSVSEGPQLDCILESILLESWWREIHRPSSINLCHFVISMNILNFCDITWRNKMDVKASSTMAVHQFNVLRCDIFISILEATMDVYYFNF